MNVFIDIRFNSDIFRLAAFQYVTKEINFNHQSI